MNIAIVSRSKIPEIKSDNHSIFQTVIEASNDQEFFSKSLEYCQQNQCEILFPAHEHKYRKDVIDILMKPMEDPNIGAVFADFSLNGIPMLNTSMRQIDINVMMINLKVLSMFSNLQEFMTQSLTKHVPEILMYA